MEGKSVEPTTGARLHANVTRKLHNHLEITAKIALSAKSGLSYREMRKVSF
jgi:hypothetical protein